MSGGRAELGLGAGWYDAEHTAYGVPFPPLGERFERLEEQFAILTGLWDTPVGRDVRLRRAPLPIEGQPGACPSPCSSRTRRSSSAVAAPSGRRASPPPSPTSSTSRSRRSPTPRRSSPGCAPPARTGDATPGRCDCRRPRSSAAAPTRRRWSAAPPTSAARPTSCAANGVAGTPDEVVARLQEFAAIGAESIYLQVLDLDDLDHIALLAEEVLPRVA